MTRTFNYLKSVYPEGNAHEPWSLGVKRSGPDTIGFSMAPAIPLSIPKKIFS